MNGKRCGCFALTLLMFSSAQAGDMHGHSATLSVQGDGEDNRLWLGRLALSPTDHVWLQGSFGRTELGLGARDTTMVGGAVGFRGETISAAVEFVRREGDARFEQQDWAATLDWRGARGGLGADLSVRSASSESSTSRSGGVFGPSVTTTIRESADGTGFGLHGDFYLTPRANVFAGAMHYRYDLEVRSAATGSGTLVSSLLGSNAQLSGVWRDQALIERSYRVGASYHFDGAALAAQYFRDRTVDTEQELDTVQLQAEFAVAANWLVSPLIGYSSSRASAGTSYAGLSLGLRW